MQEFIQHVINGISIGSTYALIALGYTMVYGILQMINFAHSEVYMMGAFTSYYAARALNFEQSAGFTALVVTLLIAMAACSLLGVLIERLAYRPLRKAPKLNILITAIGVSLLLQNSAQILFGADPKGFPTIMNNYTLMKFGEIEISFFDATFLGVSLFFMGSLHYVVHYTKVGKAMRAVSANHAVASLMGINTDRIIAITFILGSSLAGVGSVLMGMKYEKLDPYMGVFIGIKAFVAAVLGGIGNLMGAVVGGILMGLSEEMVVGYFSSTYRDAFAFVILIVVLIFKPSGLFGKSSIEKV